MAASSIDSPKVHISPPPVTDKRRISVGKQEASLETTHEVGNAQNATIDQAAPSQDVSGARQRLSDIFTILCAGFALISDGYQNNLM